MSSFVAPIPGPEAVVWPVGGVPSEISSGLRANIPGLRSNFLAYGIHPQSTLHPITNDILWASFQGNVAAQKAFAEQSPKPPTVADLAPVTAGMRLLAVPPVANAGAGAAAPDASAAITAAVANLTTVTQELSKQVTATKTVTQELAKQVSALPQLLDRLADADEESVKSPMSLRYEDHVRGKIRDLLLHHCGLTIPLGVDDFQRELLGGREWDCRFPALVAGPAAGAAAITDKFVIFPSKPEYKQPPKLDPRQVTPQKYGGASVPPLAHYLGIFEFTIAKKWTKPYHGRPGLLVRLEQRLQITYDRARSSVDSISSITDIVAVVGVVAPSAYTTSVRSLMEEEPSPFPKLKEMMDAGRFVFICVPKPASSSPRRGASSRGGASSTTSAPKATLTPGASGSL